MYKITATIKREWLKKIANRTKHVGYREIKPYWGKFPISGSGAVLAPSDKRNAAERAGNHRRCDRAR